MGTATAQGPAAPKPQQYPPPPMPRPGPEHPPPAVLTVAELEAAVAALPGKRDALREAFDRLAACSPSPLPFAWRTSTITSPRSSGQSRCGFSSCGHSRPPAPHPLPPRRGELAEGVVEGVEQEEEDKADEEMQEGDDAEAGDKIDKGGKDEEEARDEVLEEEVEAANDKIGNRIKDEKDAEEELDAVEEMQVANEEQSPEDCKKASQDKEEDVNMEAEQIMEDGNKGSLDKEEDANMEAEQSMEDGKKASLDKVEDANIEEEQDTNMEEAATEKASALQSKEQEACGEKQVEEEEQEAHSEEKNAKNTTKEEEAKKVSLGHFSQPRPGPVEFNDLTTAFASMDTRRLVKFMHTNIRISMEFHHAAMHHAPDGAALSLRVVELFLHDKTLKTNNVWSNCVGLIRTVPEFVTKLSTESIEHAKRLAKDWKEMIDNPGSWMALGSRASWGLLNFLISYNIVSEFDTKEIFRIFGTIPRKQQRKNHSVLFKGLGLADRIPELMDYLIGNGQQMNVLYLAPFFNLVDKYPPLPLLKGYVKKAKQTVVEISQKNMTRQSLREVIMNELDNLRMAHDLADKKITDSVLRTSIMAEINVLLREFGRKKRNLADASAAITSDPQQQQTESKKRKKEQEPEQRQQSKPGEKLEKKQNKPQQEQQQKKQNKPQQKQEEKPHEKQQQNEHQHLKQRRRRAPKLSAWASYAAQNVLVPLRGNYVHPPFTATHGVHHGYPAQPGWPGVHCAAPPAPQLGGPEYVGPSNPFYPHPQYYT
ncbi:unnamed protein product [Urochloa decumbens]|uniref:FRIGIDA-like protein n=1 Tax=Urochloa decumbens TaxID=240449 RepID=A0ABC8XI02_9POAL